MTVRRFKIITCIIVLYAFTWIGGAIVYRRDMETRAKATYAAALEVQAKLQADQGTSRTIVHPNGPRTSLKWCIPLLPALLLVSSDYHIGPLWGDGGIRVVLFYGAGTLESHPFFGWMS